MTDDSDVARADDPEDGADDGTDDSKDAENAAEDEVVSMYDQSPASMPGGLSTGGASPFSDGESDGGDGSADSAADGDVNSDGEDANGDGEAEDSEDATDDANDEPLSPGFEAPLLGDDNKGPERATGTFYVKAAEEVAVILHDVNSSQIFTLIENPGFEGHDIVEATLVAQPPMEVSYVIDELEAHYTIPIETSSEPPTRRNLDIGSELDPMEAVAVDREGEGEIHLLRVDPDNVGRTAEELHDDEMTYKNAARLGVERVEIRTDEDEGIVSIRYLP